MGLPGAGKSTVLERIKSEHKEYVVKNYGDLMFEIEKEEYGIKHRDEMRTIPIEKQKEVQRMVVEYLSTIKGKFILDTHCSVSTPKGFLPGLSQDLLKGVKITSLVLITADPKEIEARRANDPTRKRDNDDIALHDHMNRAYLASYSTQTGAPAVVIYNRQGKLEDAVAKLKSIL